MSGYLLDTHIWLWHLNASDRLPSGIRDLIDHQSGACSLSAVSVWELGLLVERGRVAIAGSLRDVLGDARRRLRIAELPLTSEIALTSREIQLEHRDPADRFLAATALVHELTLLTIDDRLTSREWLPTRSA